jgi:hypothetical protein
MLKDLDTWIADLRAHRARLASELERVDAALAALTGDTSPSKTSASGREGSASPMLDLLEAMFAKEPDRKFSAESALETLRKTGWESDAADPLNAMRTALSRMNKRGEIHRIGRGMYRKNKGGFAVPPVQQPPPTFNREDEADTDNS